MDLTRLSEAEKTEACAQVRRFLRQQELAQLGSYHQLPNAQTDRWFNAWMTVAPDQSKALVNVVLLSLKANAPIHVVGLRRLNSAKQYRDGNGTVHLGAALMNTGVLPPLRGDYSALKEELEAFE